MTDLSDFKRIVYEPEVKALRERAARAERRVAELEAARPRVIAMAILHRDWESDIANTIPQTVWDALYEEGLVANRTDETGERTPYLTLAGEDALLGVLAGDGGGALPTLAEIDGREARENMNPLDFGGEC